MSPEEGTSVVRLLKKQSMLKQVWNEAPIRTPRFKSVIRERKSLDFILLGLFNLCGNTRFSFWVLFKLPNFLCGRCYDSLYKPFRLYNVLASWVAQPSIDQGEMPNNGSVL